jgi:DNA-binding NarL/FixJ family response regulator
LLFRVSIVEDNPGLHARLARLFNGALKFSRISGSGANEGALAWLPAGQRQVILMEINLTGGSGFECARDLKTRNPSLIVVMLSVHEGAGQVLQALLAVASGCLLKPTSPKQVLTAIVEVLKGSAPIASHLAHNVAGAFHSDFEAKLADEIDELSLREAEVLELLAKGHLVKEIAVKLGIGFGSVRTYVRRIYEKLHVRSRSQAIAKYFNAGGPSINRRLSHGS